MAGTTACLRFAPLLACCAALAACGGVSATTSPLAPLLAPPPPRPPLAADEAAPIRRLHPGVLRGLMIGGSLRVEPDAALTEAVAAHGDEPLLAIVAVCLDPEGNATGMITRPSQVPAFDAAALALVGTWRFRPFIDGGVATPACSLAGFRHGNPPLPPDQRLPPGWHDALPAARIELPPSVHVPIGVYARADQPRPTRGVALAWVCRDPGSRAAPRLVWLQSSGDPATDRAMFDRRATMPLDEPPAPGAMCSMWSALAGKRDADDAGEPALMATVASEELGRARVSGDRNIFPDDDVKIMIQESGVWQFVVPVVTCVDVTGRPSLVAILKSSGFPRYDADLIRGVASWRYRPVLVDGKPSPACGIVNFAYRQR